MAYDFTQISAQGLAVLAAKRLNTQVPTGMGQRFVARAHTEGIDISEGVKPKPRDSSSHYRLRLVTTGAAAATVVLLVSFVIFRAKLLTRSSDDSRAVTATIALPSSPSPSPHSESATESRVNQDLIAAQKQLSSMDAMLKAQRAELESWKNNNRELASQLAQTQQQNAAFERERGEQDTRIKQLEAASENAKSDNETKAAVIATEENQLRTLEKKLAEQSEALKQQQALTTKGSDVRDLVVARNLHIIDVHDRDGNGKPQRTFGRIFYTEGKSLIFYAYDLADPHKLDAKVSFHVWGERLGSAKPIRSLGVLHNDDASDGRWVLTFDDPQVLAQIDSVFVTAEPSQKLAKEPHGERILFAFLGGKPNHP